MLLVDEDEGCLRAAARLLERAGLATATARTLAEARHAIASALPACIVTEFRLPDGSAIDILVDLRARDPGIGRVVLSGSADPAVFEDAVNRGGAHAVFSKPWDGPALVQGIRGVLTQCSLEREREALLRELGEKNRHLEDMVAERTRQLEHAKRELEAVFDAWEHPVAIVGPGCTVARANTAWARESDDDVRHAPGKRCHSALLRLTAPCPGCPVPAGSGAAEFDIAAGDARWQASVQPFMAGRAEGAFLCRYRKVYT